LTPEIISRSIEINFIFYIRGLDHPCDMDFADAGA